jgi:hypothetical protein
MSGASADLHRELRDSLLQDLLALGMLTTALRGRLEATQAAPDVLPLITELSTAIDRDVDAVREALARIERAA